MIADRDCRPGREGGDGPGRMSMCFLATSSVRPDLPHGPVTDVPRRILNRLSVANSPPCGRVDRRAADHCVAGNMSNSITQNLSHAAGFERFQRGGFVCERTCCKTWREADDPGGGVDFSAVTTSVSQRVGPVWSSFRS